VLGNSLLSSTFVDDPLVDGPIAGKLEAIKKNGTFQPLMKTDFGVANFICIKSGPPSEDQDADETCMGEPGTGLLPGESQSMRLEMDYGDFRGLILRVAPGTLVTILSRMRPSGCSNRAATSTAATSAGCPTATPTSSGVTAGSPRRRRSQMSSSSPSTSRATPPP
jgi:hypothetical protein